jgi:hypothetical protein
MLGGLMITVFPSDKAGAMTFSPKTGQAGMLVNLVNLV